MYNILNAVTIFFLLSNLSQIVVVAFLLSVSMFELRHEISNNALDYSMTVKLLTNNQMLHMLV